MDLIKIENNTALLNPETSSKIAEWERQLKVIKEQEETLKTAILAEMEAKGIIKIETDDLAINYIAPTDKESFDSKTFKAENPDIYDAYVKISPVKAYIKIKVK